MAAESRGAASESSVEEDMVRGGDGLHGGFFSFCFSALLAPLAHLRLHLQHPLLLRHRPVSEWAGDGQKDPSQRDVCV
jgi:hypothetical protein